jgi:hypothetical protein
MTNDELYKEAREAFREQAHKYTYYLIALCVACIAFSVHQTMGLKMKLTQIPLGAAVICWIFSIYQGLTYLQGVIKLLSDNLTIFEVLKQNPTTMTTPEVSQMFIEILGPMSKKNEKKPRLQVYSFYLGTIFFIAWRIVEML